MRVSNLAVGLLLSVAILSGRGQDAVRQDPPITLAECLRLALTRNREIQIERINPRLAQLTYEASAGYYDPVFAVDARWMRVADTGGYDPDDLSRDSIHSAEANLAKMGLSGVLPTGTRYELLGTGSHTFGERNGLDIDSYSLYAGFEVQQPLLRDAWIDEGRWRIRVNRKNLRISEFGVCYVILDVVRRVEQAYAELQFTHEHLRIQEQLLEVREKLLAEARQLVEVGRLASYEETLARSQVAQVQAELISARNEVALKENDLRTLLGGGFMARPRPNLVPADPLTAPREPLDLETAWQRGMTNRPELAQIRLDLEKADLTIKYWKNQTFPWLDLVAGYGRQGSSTGQPVPPAQARGSLSSAFDEIDDGRAPNGMLGVIFSMPLGRRTERSSYRMNKELKEQVLLRLKQKEELVQREIDDAIHSARAGFDRVEATRFAAEYAQAAIDAELQKLAAGKSTYFVVLRLQGDLAKARSDEARSRADYRQALAQLRFSDASSLEHHGMIFEAP